MNPEQYDQLLIWNTEQSAAAYNLSHVQSSAEYSTAAGQKPYRFTSSVIIFNFPHHEKWTRVSDTSSVFSSIFMKKKEFPMNLSKLLNLSSAWPPTYIRRNVYRFPAISTERLHSQSLCLMFMTSLYRAPSLPWASFLSLPPLDQGRVVNYAKNLMENIFRSCWNNTVGGTRELIEDKAGHGKHMDNSKTTWRLEETIMSLGVAIR